MRSSILLKAWMGLTGLFLALFVLVHMVGNLQLFLPQHLARASFNAYSQALSSNVVIKIAGWLTYAAVLTHAVVSAVLARRNRASRPYAQEQPGTSSPWYARSMGWLGAVTLAFLVLHMHAFWYRYHWGEIGLDERGNKDLYTVVVTSFQEPWIVLVYVGSMVALGFHLQHGIAAALRSLGVFSDRITALAPRVSAWFAWSVAGAFATMPIYVYIAFGSQAP
ncbi:MAG: succinate dehydrogenase cytochrome b subunit [Nannocystales bacterium]